jgi:uncharacterized protein YbjT (DUF2867 family)
MAERNEIVTVFGGTGFIGRHLVRRLARSGAVVRVACRRPSRAGFLKMAGAVGQIVPMAVDVRDERSIDQALKGADRAVNLIGVLFPEKGGGFAPLHVDAAGRIAARAKAAGVEALVHVSALGADPASPSAYARSKADGETAVRAGFPEAAILRPSVVFGPEDEFLNRFAAMAALSPVLPLIGGGQTRFQPVWVGDVAEAIDRALGDRNAAGRTFDLGGPAVYTFEALLRLVLALTGRTARFAPLSWTWAERLAGLFEKVPFVTPPLTRDQVELLKTDNVTVAGRPGLADLGIVRPVSVEVMAPMWLLPPAVRRARHPRETAAGRIGNIE